MSDVNEWIPFFLIQLELHAQYYFRIHNTPKISVTQQQPLAVLMDPGSWTQAATQGWLVSTPQCLGCQAQRRPQSWGTEALYGPTAPISGHWAGKTQERHHAFIDGLRSPRGGDLRTVGRLLLWLWGHVLGFQETGGTLHPPLWGESGIIQNLATLFSRDSPSHLQWKRKSPHFWVGGE